MIEGDNFLQYYLIIRSQMAIINNHLAKILSFFEGQVISGPFVVATFKVL